ncbi:MAG: GNAT family N-acetyltransferase [Candidatus Eisenbacteria bacterium]
MRAIIRPYTGADLETLRSLIESPGIATQLDIFIGRNALEQRLADPRLPESCIRLAFVDDEPAGFGFAWVLPGPPYAWTSPRIGVHERFRRRGIGRRLLEQVIEASRRVPAGEPPRELSAAAWVPDPAAEGFAAAIGWRHDRWFWLMERPRGATPEPVWPAGATVRVFDGSERAIVDWNEAYNRSFAEHYHYVPSSLDDARALVAGPGFRNEAVLLAHRDDRCVGFCRCEIHHDRGEIGTLGVTPEARGIGLGRALLRRGVRWLEADNAMPVTLMVDGENESALGLYRSEGFEVTRTRRVWVKPLDGGGA